MTINEIIRNIETSMSDIEDMTQIPEENKNQIIANLEAANDILENMADEYGEEPEEIDDDEE